MADENTTPNDTTPNEDITEESSQELEDDENLQTQLGDESEE